MRTGLFLLAGFLLLAKAGYAAAEKLPVLLLLFGVPAVVAVVLKWKFL